MTIAVCMIIGLGLGLIAAALPDWRAGFAVATFIAIAGIAVMALTTVDTIAVSFGLVASAVPSIIRGAVTASRQGQSSRV